MKSFFLLICLVLFSCAQQGAYRSYIMVEKIIKVPKSKKVEFDAKDRRPLSSEGQFKV